jgi:tetratricopeptide (TPR) repeat protein
MLKPKKKITKREIRHDPLLETLYSAQRFISQFKNRIILIMILFFLIISTILIISRSNAAEYAKSNVMLARAVSYISSNPNKALEDFENLLMTFPESEASIEAHFHMGRIHLSLDSTDAAKVNFDTYLELAPEELFSSASMSQLANIALYNDESALAGDLFDNAAEKSSVNYIMSVNKLNAVEAFITAGEISRAKELLFSISINPENEKRFETLKIRISRSLNK